MCPSPQAWHVRSSATGATAADGTAPVQPTSRGDSSPAGAVCGVAEASTVPSETSAGGWAPFEARAATTRSAPHASQKVESAWLAVPQAGQSREAVAPDEAADEAAGSGAGSAAPV